MGAGDAEVVGDRELPVGGTGNGFDPGARRAAMQRAQAGAFRPMGATLWHMAPDAQRHLLDAAHHEVLMVVAVGHYHAENFQHRVGEVRVPAAGAKPDLTKHFAMLERQLGEGFGGGDKVIEGAVVPQRNQRIPQLFQARDVAVADGLLYIAKARAFLQRVCPGVSHFLEQGG